jgi:hypothetical protein
MVETPDATPEQRTIARLQARVEALEAALEERSREMRLLQRHLCARDLVVLSRLRSGLPPLPRGAYDPAFWRETTHFTPADVEETLEDLWSSVIPSGRASNA